MSTSTVRASPTPSTPCAISAPNIPDAELFFITGADAVAEIMQWKDADLMWDLAHFVAVTRPGYSSPDGVTLPEGKVENV